jgi:hypothetical protein
MFRIVCFVDDKKLAKVKWLLHGHVYNMTDAPVINAKREDRTVRAKASAGKRSEMFKHWLQRHKLKEVNPQMVRNFCESVGLSDGSYSAILTAATSQGFLQRIGGEYRYKVLLKPAVLHKRKKVIKRTKKVTPAKEAV